MSMNKNIMRIALATAILLLVPLVAMRITDAVNWTVADFAFAGVLLFGTGLTYELVARKTVNAVYRIAVGIALGATLFLIWANAAVGLIGSEDNPANLMYGGVLAVEIIGVTLARFRPEGMARALFATALAQALVAVIALIAGEHRSSGSSVYEIVNVSGFFAVLFVLSALLFRQAGATAQGEGKRATKSAGV